MRRLYVLMILLLSSPEILLSLETDPDRAPGPCAAFTGPSAQFCTINALSLCVSGNTQVGGDLTVQGTIAGNLETAYGYFYDPNFSIVLSETGPVVLPFSQIGIVNNFTHPTATDVSILLPGIYAITALIEPSVALNTPSTYEIQQNGVLVPGSSFPMGVGISGLQLTLQAIVVAQSGDHITLVVNAVSTDTLTGICSLCVNKIA